MVSITFAEPYIAVYRPSARGYDFLEYNGDDYKWDIIDALDIEGIFINYDRHPIANSNTHLILNVGRGKHIDIRITNNIMKLANTDIWICVVDLCPESTFRSTHTRLLKRNIPILTELPDRPSLGSQRYRPNNMLIIPNNIDQDHYPLYRAIFDILSAMRPDKDINDTIREFVEIYMIMLTAGLVEKDKKRLVPMPMHIADIIARDAVIRNEVCPITMENISLENYAVTSCFHVFDRDAIAIWRTTNTTCPVCKQECIVTTKG
jgi:hypothetical protein